MVWMVTMKLMPVRMELKPTMNTPSSTGNIFAGLLVE